MENKELLEEKKIEEEVVELSQKKDKKPQKNRIMLVVAVIVSVLIIAFAVYYVKKSANSPVVVNSAVIATVNGEKITKTEYDAVFEQLLPQIEQAGLSDNADYLKGIKTQILDGLVNDKLLLQNAKKSQVIATEEEVKKELASITERAGGEEKLNTQISKEGLTKEKLIDNVKNQIVMQKYLLANINLASLSVSEDEIKAFYDNASKGQEGVPDLKEVSSQINDQIMKNKQQKLVSDFLGTLRASADINIF
jgi:hypothetical protein